MRLITREFALLWIGQVVANMGVSMVQPLLPIFVEDQLGAPPIGVALSFGGVGVASLFVAPWIGRNGDRIGPKPFLVAGFLVYAVAGFGYLIAANWETVVAFRILSGVGAAFIFSMAPAYAGMLAPPGREGELMGWFAVTQVVGSGIGPLLGGGLSDAFNTDAAFGTMAVLLALNAVSIGLLLPSRPPVGTGRGPAGDLSLRAMLRFRPTQVAMWVQAVTGFTFGAGASFVGVYVVSDAGLGTGSALLAGVLFTARSVASGIVNPFAGRLLADRMDRVKLSIAGLIAIAASQAMIPLVPGTVVDVPGLGDAVVLAPWLLLLFVLMGVAQSILGPAQQGIYIDVGRRIGMGAIMSLTQWTSNAGFLIGAVVVGTVIVPAFGLAAVFPFTAAVVVAGALGFAVMVRWARVEMRSIGQPAAPGEGPGSAVAEA